MKQRVALQLWFEIRDNEGEREKLKKLVTSSSCQDNALMNKKRRYKRRGRWGR